jgi:hypothetical protein
MSYTNLSLFHGSSHCFARLYHLIIKVTFPVEETFVRTLFTRRVFLPIFYKHATMSDERAVNSRHFCPV